MNSIAKAAIGGTVVGTIVGVTQNVSVLKMASLGCVIGAVVCSTLHMQRAVCESLAVKCKLRATTLCMIDAASSIVSLTAVSVYLMAIGVLTSPVAIVALPLLGLTFATIPLSLICQYRGTPEDTVLTNSNSYRGWVRAHI